MKRLIQSLSKTVDFLYDEIDKNFVRKHFSDFSYLKVELTTGQLIAVWVVSIIITIALCIWVVVNPFMNEMAETVYRYRTNKRSIENIYRKFNTF